MSTTVASSRNGRRASGERAPKRAERQRGSAAKTPDARRARQGSGDGGQRAAGAGQGAQGARRATGDAKRSAVRRDADRSGSRDDLMAIQRARMISAMAEIVRERGAGELTVSAIVARSGLSRRTFYELFADWGSCFGAALELAVERAAQRVLPAYQAAGSWQERMRVGLATLLEFLEDEPDLGSLCVVGALGGGPAVLQQRAQFVEILVDAVDAGRLQMRGGLRPTRLTAEGVVGAVLAVLHARLAVSAPSVSAPSVKGQGTDKPSADEPSADGSASSITGLLGSLMAIVVLPYRGAAAATREAARPVPPARRRDAHAEADPLRDLDMRLTYRTLRTLLAISANPEASNRQVADAAGVHDQGQISKLLARLEHLGLISNAAAGGGHGEPNAWRLTPRGEQVRAISQQVAPTGR